MYMFDKIQIKPCFKRQGNKYPLKKKIIPEIPQHSKYIEAFCGTGAIFFNKQKVSINVLNDLDEGIIKGLNLLKIASSDITKYKQNMNTVENIKYFYDNHEDTNEDNLMFEIIKTNGFSGKPAKSSKEIYSKYCPLRKIKNIDIYKDKLKDVILISKDYEEVIKEYDSEDSFFFLDPPYENTLKSFGYAEDKSFNYERLLNVIKNIKGKFFLTINDSPYMRELFKNYTMEGIEISTPWGHQSATAKKTRKELFIKNY